MIPDATPHPSGARPPAVPRELVPRHVALVMDGNGRWAKQRGLPRTAGHEQGESSLFDVVEGAIEIGVGWLSAYAFSTENWKRSPDEVRFLMGFNRDVIRRRRDEMHAMGVRVRWAGRRPRLWKSVIEELRDRGGDDPRQPGADADDVRELRRPGRDRRRGRGARSRRGRRSGRPGEGHRARSWRATSTSRTCLTSICSCGPRGSSGRRTFCCGSRRTRRWCSRTRCGRTTTGASCGPRSRSMRDATAATAEPRICEGAVVRLHHVNIVVRPGETERLVDFYTDVLGLRPADEAD